MKLTTKERSALMEKANGVFDRNEDIRLQHSKGKSCTELGREHGISRQMVNRIVHR